MPGRKPKQLSFDEFLAKHESEFAEADDYIEIDSSLPAPTSPIEVYSAASLKPTPFSRRMNELRQWWLVRLLTAAGRENSPEAYRELLEHWLSRMGARPPKGVFIPLPRSPGRPRSGHTEEVYWRWVLIGKPSLFERKLAHSIFGAAFTRADGDGRKKMVDRCRRAVERHQQRLKSGLE
jgi:hypothetical protein